MPFHDRLLSELTQMDERLSKKKGYNPYALAIMFGAVEGVTDADSFAAAFNPTRELHRVARNLGLGLGVVHGQWVKK